LCGSQQKDDAIQKPTSIHTRPAAQEASPAMSADWGMAPALQMPELFGMLDDPSGLILYESR
jgi:hypothetical protein